ncbi:MAG: alpha,alpha-trehalase TreF [Balneolaceae bacterium]
MAEHIPSDLIQCSGELFEAVQQSGIFSDSKYFVDCTPAKDPSAILKAFRAERHSPGFDLKAFVDDHFHPPENPGEELSMKQHATCSDHIRALWPHLFRTSDKDTPEHASLIPLPYPYVVPGGRFREIYYWDSYFTAHGLVTDGHADMAVHMARNFAYLINNIGHVPNGNRAYYGSRSQPPFFVPLSQLVLECGNEQLLQEFTDAAIKEHAFWRDEPGEPNRRLVRFTDRDGTAHSLNRYWDDHPAPRQESWIEDVELARDAAPEQPEPFYRHIRAACESGWDFTSRWFADGQNLRSIETTDILPVDLNALLWFSETRIAAWCRELGRAETANEFDTRANERKASIQSLMWDDELGFYVDYHLKKKSGSGRLSLAAVYPLYVGLADHQQATQIAERLERDFLADGGLLTTPVNTGQQWDAPNGWAPLQWMAVVGLERYGHTTLAETVARRWLGLNEAVYKRTGKMVEKYNVSDLTKKGGGGEYPLQDGFGWSNGVYQALRERYPA